MGQQQLLLLVLGIVIVGLAVVVGIQAFSENQKKANADALVMTGMRIASDAQAWLRKPNQFGGAPLDASGNRRTDFNGLTVGTEISLEGLGYPVDATSGNYVDVNGIYAIAVNGNNLVISGGSATTSGAGDNNLICVTVSGVLVDNIVTAINPSTVPGGCSVPTP